MAYPSGLMVTKHFSFLRTSNQTLARTKSPLHVDSDVLSNVRPLKSSGMSWIWTTHGFGSVGWRRLADAVIFLYQKAMITKIHGPCSVIVASLQGNSPELWISHLLDPEALLPWQSPRHTASSSSEKPLWKIWRTVDASLPYTLCPPSEPPPHSFDTEIPPVSSSVIFRLFSNSSSDGSSSLCSAPETPDQDCQGRQLN
jgi:hypothetical protein